MIDNDRLFADYVPNPSFHFVEYDSNHRNKGNPNYRIERERDAYVYVPTIGVRRRVALIQFSENFLWILSGKSFQSPDITFCWNGDSEYTTAFILTGVFPIVDYNSSATARAQQPFRYFSLFFCLSRGSG